MNYLVSFMGNLDPYNKKGKGENAAWYEGPLLASIRYMATKKEAFTAIVILTHDFDKEDIRNHLISAFESVKKGIAKKEEVTAKSLEGSEGSLKYKEEPIDFEYKIYSRESSGYEFVNEDMINNDIWIPYIQEVLDQNEFGDKSKNNTYFLNTSSGTPQIKLALRFFVNKGDKKRILAISPRQDNRKRDVPQEFDDSVFDLIKPNYSDEKLVEETFKYYRDSDLKETVEMFLRRRLFREAEEIIDQHSNESLFSNNEHFTIYLSIFSNMLAVQPNKWMDLAKTLPEGDKFKELLSPVLKIHSSDKYSDILKQYSALLHLEKLYLDERYSDFCNAMSPLYKSLNETLLFEKYRLLSKTDDDMFSMGYNVLNAFIKHAPVKAITSEMTYIRLSNFVRAFEFVSRNALQHPDDSNEALSSLRGEKVEDTFKLQTKSAIYLDSIADEDDIGKHLDMPNVFGAIYQMFCLLYGLGSSEVATLCQYQNLLLDTVGFQAGIEVKQPSLYLPALPSEPATLVLLKSVIFKENRESEFNFERINKVKDYNLLSYNVTNKGIRGTVSKIIKNANPGRNEYESFAVLFEYLNYASVINGGVLEFDSPIVYFEANGKYRLYKYLHDGNEWLVSEDDRKLMKSCLCSYLYRDLVDSNQIYKVSGFNDVLPFMEIEETTDYRISEEIDIDEMLARQFNFITGNKYVLKAGYGHPSNPSIVCVAEGENKIGFSVPYIQGSLSKGNEMIVVQYLISNILDKLSELGLISIPKSQTNQIFKLSSEECTREEFAKLKERDHVSKLSRYLKERRLVGEMIVHPQKPGCLVYKIRGTTYGIDKDFKTKESLSKFVYEELTKSVSKDAKAKPNNFAKKNPSKHQNNQKQQNIGMKQSGKTPKYGELIQNSIILLSRGKYINACIYATKPIYVNGQCSTYQPDFGTFVGASKAEVQKEMWNAIQTRFPNILEILKENQVSAPKADTIDEAPKTPETSPKQDKYRSKKMKCYKHFEGRDHFIINECVGQSWDKVLDILNDYAKNSPDANVYRELPDEDIVEEAMELIDKPIIDDKIDSILLLASAMSMLNSLMKKTEGGGSGFIRKIGYPTIKDKGVNALIDLINRNPKLDVDVYCAIDEHLTPLFVSFLGKIQFSFHLPELSNEQKDEYSKCRKIDFDGITRQWCASTIYCTIKACVEYNSKNAKILEIL